MATQTDHANSTRFGKPDIITICDGCGCWIQYAEVFGRKPFPNHPEIDLCIYRCVSRWEAGTLTYAEIGIPVETQIHLV